MATGVKGTEGYAEAADRLVPEWQRLSFADQHQHNLHLLPTEAADVLDIGAGIGTDAAGFAALGHRVVAVEPVDAFRSVGLLRCPRALWIDDALPGLAATLALGRRFDFVAAMAVLMHLDAAERRAAFAALVPVLNPAARLVLSLRHGPAPAGRRVFAVDGDEVVALALQHGLTLVHRLERPSLQPSNRALGINWTHLAFGAPVTFAPLAAK